MNRKEEKSKTCTYLPNQEIVSWEYSRWLCLSSFLFMIPSIYSFYYKHYFITISLGMTSLISANYWRKATNSFRRNLDLIYSKIIFLIYGSNGIYYIRYIPYVITAYSGLFIIIYSYRQSNLLFQKQQPEWLNYHILFHVILTYELMIFLHSIF